MHYSCFGHTASLGTDVSSVISCHDITLGGRDFHSRQCLIDTQTIEEELSGSYIPSAKNLSAGRQKLMVYQ